MAMRTVLGRLGKSAMQSVDGRALLLQYRSAGNRPSGWRKSCSCSVPSRDASKYALLGREMVDVRSGRPGRISAGEAGRMLRTVDVGVNALRPMVYGEFLELCKHLGMASCYNDAKDLTKSLEESGAVLVFDDKVFVRPEQVSESLTNAIAPCISESVGDSRRAELSQLRCEKQAIDRIAFLRMRSFLWAGLALYTTHMAACFRLTFWELSWDVMEPITFFTSNTALLLAGYLFFLATNKDPSHGRIAKAIFRSQQKKLMAKRQFDMNRFRELEVQSYWLALASGLHRQSSSCGEEDGQNSRHVFG